ncbi:hypothetical protein [Pontibacter vulgaris]|uniref:hypothetical protein n=1 Tax=Pontibacter vulgaris TaxID=2905679 RepID=UPI001FA72E75|nr:hypothetical protein [Pontibacter vulgaris]
MKKIVILTIFGLLLYVNGFSQQQVTIHDIVTITLPDNAEKLTKEKLAALKPKNGETSPIVHEQSKGDSYKGENFLIQLNAAYTTPTPGFLEQQKREMDDLFSLSQPQVYSSSIKHFQNQSIVITNFEDAGRDKGYFLLRSYNKSGDSILVGTLEYDKGNKETAEKILEEILKSIKFKKP